MDLPAVTVRNLELFTGKKSLFNVMNRCKSRPGARMLKDWLAHPLTDKPKIESRLDSVQFLLESGDFLSETDKFFKFIPDLENLLMSALNKRIKPKDFVRLCESLAKIRETASEFGFILRENNPNAGLKSILDDLTSSFSNADGILENIDGAAAKNSVFDRLFRRWTDPKIGEKRREIEECERSFEDHKKVIRSALGLARFEYATVSGLEYLIEVKVKQINLVPGSWTKVNGTKQVCRFRTPFIFGALPKLQFLRENLRDLCENEWKCFLDQFLAYIPKYQFGVKRLSEMDCLVSLAHLARQDGFSRPTFLATDDQGAKLTFVEGRNIVLRELLGPDKALVANDCDLDNRGMLLTGANMGGKSSYLRQLAATVILAQMGSYVPASETRMTLFDGVYIRTGARDDAMAGKSTLKVELDEADLILRRASKRSLVLLDELGRGTATADGCAVAKAVFDHLLRRVKCPTVFVTHYRQLTREPDVANFHMGYEDLGGEDGVVNLYKLKPGASSSSFGLTVAKMAGMPQSIIDVAKVIAERGADNSM